MHDKKMKEQVRVFWEQETCGSGVAKSDKYTKAYFDEIEAHRYRAEPFIHKFAQFTRQEGKRVLEVGVGAGTDHLQFARAGAHLFGIDLTDASIDMVRKRLAIEGLHSDLRRCDAENLPFESNSFDYVYSWGVLHHTPDTERALEEVYRVCKPGGKVCIMVYHRRSLFALALWMRCALLQGRPFSSFTDIIFHHMESIGTKSYTIKEIRKMFVRFRSVAVMPVLTPYDIPRMPAFIGRFIPNALGWFVVIQALK